MIHIRHLNKAADELADTRSPEEVQLCSECLAQFCLNTNFSGAPMKITHEIRNAIAYGIGLGAAAQREASKQREPE